MVDFFVAGEIRPHPSTKPETSPIMSQVVAMVAAAQDRANHTGTQLAATISDLPAYVQAYIDGVIDAAPAALDTLNELAAALGDDPNFAATINSLYAALNVRVTALEGAVPPRRLTALVGDGLGAVFNIDHNWALANQDLVEVSAVDTITHATVLVAATRPTANRVTIDFGIQTPAVNQYRVMLREI